MALPVLIISGAIGSGKTTVGLAAQEVLEEHELPHAYLDLDRLGDSYPRVGRFNEDVMFEALGAVWPVYRSYGAQRLLLSHVVEEARELERYEEVLGPCSFTIAVLKATEKERMKRVEAREFGDSLKWHMNRTVELDQILSDRNLHDFEVENNAGAPHETALEILERAGWIGTNRDAV